MSHRKNGSFKVRFITVVALLILANACTSRKNVKAGTGESASMNSSAIPGLTPMEAEAIAADEVQADNPPHYDAIGGETLSFVAMSLYGSRGAVKQLLEKNPNLKTAKALEPGQKVYFDVDALNPQPRFLNKLLLNHYAKELAAHLDADTEKQKHIVLGHGETLQKLSMRLYGTGRYWPEIYLLNYHELPGGYDDVPAGTNLVVVKRNGPIAHASHVHKNIQAEAAPVAAPATTPIAARTDLENLQKMEKPSSEPSADQGKSNSVEAPTISRADLEKIEATAHSDTGVQDQATPQAESMGVAAPAVKSSSPFPQLNTADQKLASNEDMPRAPPEMQSAEDESSASNIRRIVYVALIVAIAGMAFYMTRPAKKHKFDMLDATAQDFASSSRPRMNDRDDRNTKNAG